MRNNYIKEGLVYGITGVLSRFTGVFLIPIYTRFLTTNEYGLLDLCTSLSAILFIVVEMQMVSGVGRSYYECKGKKDCHSLIGCAIFYYCIANLLLWGLAWSLSGTIPQYLPGFETKLLIPIVAAILPKQIIQLLLVVLRLEHCTKTYLCFTVGQIWFAVALGIVAVIVLNAGITGILWSLALANIFFAFPALIMLYRKTGIKFNLKYFREIFSYGAPIVPAVLGGWLRSSASRLFIVAALSLPILGIYSISAKVASFMLLLTMAFRLTYTPYAMKKYMFAKSEPWFAKVLNLYLFATFLTLILFSSGSSIIVHILAPKPYWGATPYVLILASAYALDGATTILAAGNAWVRKTYYNTWGSLAGGALNVVLLWLFIESFGLPLVALSYWVSTIVKVILTMATSQRNHYIPYSQK